jgi:hypothetical protein
MFYGAWPEGEIDHINGNRADNRIGNLRDITADVNRRNMKLSKASATGVSGVSWCKTSKRWLVRIRINKRTKNIGRYSDFDTAVAVRKAAEREYDYHTNHGMRTTAFDLHVTPTLAYTEARPPRRRARA